MKILALKGKNSCGKSTTLNLVHDELTINLGGTSTTKKTLGNPSQHDFECIVTLNNQKIAFYTMGDYSMRILDAIKRYNTLGVDILILATNNRFVKPTKEILKYDNTIFLKTIADPENNSNNLIANQFDCSLIVSKI